MNKYRGILTNNNMIKIFIKNFSTIVSFFIYSRVIDLGLFNNYKNKELVI